MRTSPATAAESFAAFLAERRPAVDRALDRLLPGAEDVPSTLHEALRYAVFAGGKRVRPVLALMAAESHGASQETLLAPAAALELIHTYSLVHDDLPALDDDDLRRGRQTVHRRYDEATAVLVGDALLTLGFTVLAEEPADAPAERRRRAVSMVGRAVGSRGMIGGQMEDLAAEARWPADPEGTLARIHRRKTGALLVVSLRLGGLLAGAGPDEDDRLTRFGEQVGLLFQIGDDILDVVGSDRTLGKTAGKDAAAAKLTYPGLYGLDGSRRKLADVRDEAREMASRLPRPALWVSLVDYLATRDC